ncbi:HNH endonuclease signature motif containing protein [Klebsiella pneumoniae]|uniref:HNH endonuclease n=1 Tax=Klebsiella pneumoniae TaxID=573 RepID=UPI001083FBF4|nr:HNH endonuclease signature motif containing protein [Klebsiella pneumoniae]HDT1747987.1 HNH endonuclease [Klebsiella pneumoniae subsp. pneumoniae]MCY0470398.1 HNH endonuclease signature motif containing protein [Klebsiella pneumoniae]MDH8516454.1 HNH endonuclease signature motif containing protein [Klebsiella pneumoniae]MDH8591395.1 HNH endonuclease signature motif containing protein [Klebsiella pneumoniae]MDT8755667.1 HNH endonuclease [Klebsiella pneumoniae]
MSTQSFNSIEREAIWSAHNKKCAYTGQSIMINGFHIDHIIPEHLAEKTDELSNIKSSLGLPDDFDIFGYENLLPCCVATNLQKGKGNFEGAHAHYFLNLAGKKKSEIIKNIGRIKKRNDKAKALLITQQYLESGRVSTSDLQAILNQSNSDDMYNLMVSLKISDEESINVIRKSDMEDLWDQKVILGDNNDIEGVVLCNSENETMLVKTSREFLEASEKGFHAETTYTLKMASYFEWQCGLLKAISRSVLPTESYIENPRVSILDIDLLPYHIFPCLSQSVDDIIDRTSTYQNMLDDNLLKITQVNNNLLRVESDVMGQQLVEVIRADFNGDGYESILCFEYTWATEGTFGRGGIVILTRKSHDALFEVVEL